MLPFCIYYLIDLILQYDYNAKKNAHFRDYGSESWCPKAAAASHFTVTSTGPKVCSV